MLRRRALPILIGASPTAHDFIAGFQALRSDDVAAFAVLIEDRAMLAERFGSYSDAQQ